MSLPPGYSGLPVEEQHHYYRNVIIEFKKVIKASKDTNRLHMHMDLFLNASKQVQWPHHTSDVYRKEEAEKAIQKIANEFKRYIRDIENDEERAYSNALLDAIALLETLTDLLKVR